MRLSNDTLIMPLGIFDLPFVNLGEDYQVVTGLEHTSTPALALSLIHGRTEAQNRRSG